MWKLYKKEMSEAADDASTSVNDASSEVDTFSVPVSMPLASDGNHKIPAAKQGL